MHGVTIHASVNLDWVADELDPVTVLALYRIVQAAVTNAATHARVSEAAVTLRSAGAVLIAEIRDEGCGFELARSRSGTGRWPRRPRPGCVRERS